MPGEQQEQEQEEEQEEEQFDPSYDLSAVAAGKKRYFRSQEEGSLHLNKSSIFLGFCIQSNFTIVVLVVSSKNLTTNEIVIIAKLTHFGLFNTFYWLFIDFRLGYSPYLILAEETRDLSLLFTIMHGMNALVFNVQKNRVDYWNSGCFASWIRVHFCSKVNAFLDFLASVAIINQNCKQDYLLVLNKNWINRPVLSDVATQLDWKLDYIEVAINPHMIITGLLLSKKLVSSPNLTISRFLTILRVYSEVRLY